MVTVAVKKAYLNGEIKLDSGGDASTTASDEENSRSEGPKDTANEISNGQSNASYDQAAPSNDQAAPSDDQRDEWESEEDEWSYPKVTSFEQKIVSPAPEKVSVEQSNVSLDPDEIPNEIPNLANGCDSEEVDQSNRSEDHKEEAGNSSDPDDWQIAKLIELFTGQSLFDYVVESEFEKRFNRKLENNWFELVESSKIFEVTK